VIFDLKSGKRRTVVRVVFSILAFIFFISFVGFGIGSDVSGGLFDAIGIGGNSSSSDDLESTYQAQIDEAEKKLDANPKDEKALTDLARYRYLTGVEHLDFNQETGISSLTEDARDQWDLALDSWEKLLKTDPKKLDPQVAGQMTCAYVPPLPQCQIDPASATDVDFAGAIKTQEAVTKLDPSAENYATLSYFLYSDGRLDEGKSAADKAIAETSGTQKKQFEKAFTQLAEQAEKQQKALKKAQKAGDTGGEPELQNPFGSLGSGTGAGGIQPATP